MHSLQINAIIGIEKEIPNEKLLKSLLYDFISEKRIQNQYKEKWEKDLKILKDSFERGKIKRTLKKHIRESMKSYEKTHRFLEIWFIPGYMDFIPHDPPGDFDWFWTSVFFSDEEEFDEFYKEKGWGYWEISCPYLEIIYMSPPKY
ncbi:MAG: hypothetical protein BAJALOKI2v1_530024 [Promethearchaeota archaeon]|nr:MAG: hypothetical protein BAJALOKI2v1_530024 [Candidatus Lokiarchaeota archaeon]